MALIGMITLRTWMNINIEVAIKMNANAVGRFSAIELRVSALYAANPATAR